MRLTFKGEMPEETALTFAVNGEERVLCDWEKEVSFEIPCAGRYEVRVWESDPPRMPRLRWWQWLLYGWLLFAVAMILLGIFRILEAWNDNEWVKDIRPYRLKASWTLDMTQDREVTFRYSRVSYPQTVQIDLQPSFEVEGADDLQVRYLPDPKRFDAVFYKKLRVIGLVSGLGLTFFAVMLTVSLTHGADAFTLIMWGICCLIALLPAILVPLHIRKELRQMKERFLKKLDAK